MLDFITFMASLFYSFKMLIALAIFIGTVCLICIPILIVYLKWKYGRKKLNGKLKVGIFHPYCNAGGGGEKVLWVALKAMQEKYPDADFYIYTGDIVATPVEILQKVKKNLNVEVENVNFIYLNKRRWVEASMYPYFTLLGQSLGSIYLGYEALSQLNPDVYIDTTGYSFTLPLFKYIANCKTGSYIHYPTITKEMLTRVSNRVHTYNNRNIIARSPFLTVGKLIYYRIFAWMYSLTGQCSDTILVNSTFTFEHLTNLWNKSLYLVYPPCDVGHLKELPRSLNRPESIRLLSLAQFRPEKNHPLQLQALYELREIVPEEIFEKITLVLCGSCRNADDNERVKDLRDLSKHLSLENNVEFKINVNYDELLKEFEKSYIGIHTMIDEHFGISVVELMAAGLIVVAHRSGGPLLDIVETSEASRLGFMCTSAEEFAHTIKYILCLSDEEVNDIRERAKASVDRFSSKKFQEEFLRGIEPLFKID